MVKHNILDEDFAIYRAKNAFHTLPAGVHNMLRRVVRVFPMGFLTPNLLGT